MKTLIVYQTKTDAAKECAEIINQKLSNCKLEKIEKVNKNVIEEYDLIIIGSGIRFSRMYSKTRKFLKKNKNELLNKKLAIYACNMLDETFSDAIKKSVPDELLENAIIIESFGGKQPFKKYTDNSWLKEENLNMFIDKINAL
ncbi:flavodoxin domain-containing protein [Haploplasma axanthum]|uniref:Protoporphyrinogen IX dehydrogenase [menaquinone] n=1 Tax=Haploplasma axanthum TaxID=29552 RepID=A0A449BDC7_HAPAX|nr:flavodoxin domain-containing protein [Haploplasma axanthum]VEU80463.1 Protoporphyrinogen IX dehydrogenase [menaquinone] [Haploplasma axanthum]